MNLSSLKLTTPLTIQLTTPPAIPQATPQETAPARPLWVLYQSSAQKHIECSLIKPSRPLKLLGLFTLMSNVWLLRSHPIHSSRRSQLRSSLTWMTPSINLRNWHWMRKLQVSELSEQCQSEKEANVYGYWQRDRCSSWIALVAYAVLYILSRLIAIAGMRFFSRHTLHEVTSQDGSCFVFTGRLTAICGHPRWYDPFHCLIDTPEEVNTRFRWFAANECICNCFHECITNSVHLSDQDIYEGSMLANKRSELKRVPESVVDRNWMFYAQLGVWAGHIKTLRSYTTANTGRHLVACVQPMDLQ